MPPAQGCCQWDLLSNPWLMSSGGGLDDKADSALVKPWEQKEPKMGRFLN